MSVVWEWLFCAHAGTVSALLGTAGSLCLAVPWAADLLLRRRSERRVADAEQAHGDHPLVETLRRLHLDLLLGSASGWIIGLGLAGALMLAASFAVILGASTSACP
jgi:hypothetical protein